MAYSFNLIDHPWVPAVDADGQAVELSLRETLRQSDRLRELGGETPLVTAALYRLLLAILQRVIPISDDPDEWQPLWEPGAWPDAALDAYLDRWRHRFDLFDAERPFYQRAHPEANTPKSVISLLYEFASGNNATLFDHHSEERGATLSPAAAARAVLATQTFGLGGLSPIPKNVFTDGPAARGVTFLVQGDTLRQTLALNLLPYPASDILATDVARDLPAWESADPFQPLERTPHGYLDYLTWQSRRVRLLPEAGPDRVVVREMLLGPGLRFSGETFDPLKYYHKGKANWRLLRFTEDRALWRDSVALLDYQPLEVRSPYALHWLHTLIEQGVPGLTHSQTKRLLAMGMANDKAKVEFYRYEQFPLPLAYLHEGRLIQHLQQVLTLSESVGRQTRLALAGLAMQMTSHEESFAKFPAGIRSWVASGRYPNRRSQIPPALDLIRSWGVESHYWAALELPFHDLLQDLPHHTQPARAIWAAVLRRAAWQALNDAIAASGDDPLALKAAVLARGKLGGGLRKALKDWPRVRRSPEEVNHVG